MTDILEVRHLVKQYNKAKSPAVNDISFSVGEGEFFAFLGPNGAGKTTTISMLTTTLKKTAGDIRIAGYDVETNAREARERTGIIFQNSSLDGQFTAEQNIRMHAALYGVCSYSPFYKTMPKAYKERVTQLASIMGLEDVLFKRVKTFSGGMKRKLEIMRSLIHTPKILFLDEPTTGLDAVSRRGMWEYIDGVRKSTGMTVFLTTHYIDEARDADRVCIIAKGEIRFLGTPDEMQDKLRQERTLILDADDRPALLAELRRLGLTPAVNGAVAVPLAERSAQEVIGQIGVPLTRLKIHDPSVEDAYINIIGGITQ
jgi:ABC-2 type transport system ATP-binding protein